VTTIKVEYGKAVLFRLDSPEFGVLDTNFLGVGEELVDISDRVVSLSVTRGRSDVLEPVRSGQCSLTLRNCVVALSRGRAGTDREGLRRLGAGFRRDRG